MVAIVGLDVCFAEARRMDLQRSQLRHAHQTASDGHKKTRGQVAAGANSVRTIQIQLPKIRLRQKILRVSKSPQMASRLQAPSAKRSRVEKAESEVGE